MSTLTLRIPNSKHQRLKQYAKEQGISLNKLFNEFATVTIAQFDTKTRFKLNKSKGDIKNRSRTIKQTRQRTISL